MLYSKLEQLKFIHRLQHKNVDTAGLDSDGETMFTCQCCYGTWALLYTFNLDNICAYCLFPEIYTIGNDCPNCT